MLILNSFNNNNGRLRRGSVNMKKNTLTIIGIFVIICLPFCTLGVTALKTSEWSWTYALSNAPYYQGDSGTVTVTFTSSCPDQLQLSSASIQFDWMTTPVAVTVNSPNIATGNQYTFPALSFNIPADLSVGSHSFTLTIQGQQKGLFGWSDISPSGTASNAINVHNAYEKVYKQNIQSVTNALTNAFNANYRSPDAQALLQQAQSMYNQATSLANQEQWQAAIDDLNTASSYASQAAAKEATYVPPTLVPTQPPVNDANSTPMLRSFQQWRY
jgi:hypothetical protein